MMMKLKECHRFNNRYDYDVVKKITAPLVRRAVSLILRGIRAFLMLRYGIILKKYFKAVQTINVLYFNTFHDIKTHSYVE